MSRWLEQRSIWQFALIWWAWMMTACLAGIATAAVWPGGHMDLASLIWAFCFSILTTVLRVWRRQQREDANTVDEWVSSRRPPSS